MKTLIQTIASTLQAYQNCQKSGNVIWQSKHEDKLRHIEKNHLPSGSGIDNGTKIDFDESTDKKIVLRFGYHHMNDGGYYTHWSDYKVVVKPAFHGIDVTISGANTNFVKDYLFDVFYHALTAEFKE